MTHLEQRLAEALAREETAKAHREEILAREEDGMLEQVEALAGRDEGLQEEVNRRKEETAEVDEKYREVKQVAGVLSEDDMVTQEGPEPWVLYTYSPLILNTSSQSAKHQALSTLTNLLFSSASC